MSSAQGLAIWMAVVLASRPGLAQAVLPAEWTGPWQTATPPEGWTFTGLGGDQIPDYDGFNDGAARLDGTDDQIAIHFSGPAGAVSYWIKGLTFSGGVFRVEQSSDGLDWTALQTYTALATNAVSQRHFPAGTARHLRFIYTEKVTGNVGLDGISIAALVPPVIAAVSATGGVARVAIAESVAGRTYALQHALALTNIPVAWNPSDSQSGTGSALVLRDLTPTNRVRYYRVLDVTP